MRPPSLPPLLLLVSLGARLCALTCTDMKGFEHIGAFGFYRAMQKEQFSANFLKTVPSASLDFRIVDRSSLLIFKFAKESVQPLSHCKRKVLDMFLARKRFLDFNRFHFHAKKIDFVPRALRCFYTLNDPERCADGYRLLTVIETERSVPLSRLVHSLAAEKLKFFFRTFRVRFRLYKAVWERVAELRSFGFVHCRLSIDNIAVVIPEDFEDLANDINLRERLVADELEEVDFKRVIKVKFLAPEFIVRGDRCATNNARDPYFGFMTTMFEGAQKEHPAFGSWELSMAFLEFESQFHMQAASLYSDTDPALAEKFKLMMDSGALKYSQREVSRKNPLEASHQLLRRNLRDMRVHRVYKTSDLQDIVDDLILKNYQMDQIMSGKSVDAMVFNSRQGKQYPYKMFMRFLRRNLVVNIKKRLDFRVNLKFLGFITFSSDFRARRSLRTRAFI